MPKSTPPDKQPDVMRAVQRIVAVFESFTAQKSSLSLQELSERIALPKSTTFRIAQSLEKALGRIEGESEMTPEAKAQIVAQLRAKIAELRAGK